MLVLIYGHRGWIGKQFVQILENENIPFYKGKSRVENKEQLLDELKTIKPTHVVSFIGRTHGVYEGEKINTIDAIMKQKANTYKDLSIPTQI